MATPTPADRRTANAADIDAEVDRIVAEGPRGTIALAGLAVASLLAMWLAFYFLVFLPRGPVG